MVGDKCYIDPAAVSIIADRFSSVGHELQRTGQKARAENLMTVRDVGEHPLWQHHGEQILKNLNALADKVSKSGDYTVSYAKEIDLNVHDIKNIDSGNLKNFPYSGKPGN